MACERRTGGAGQLGLCLEAMKFIVTHARAYMGSNIAVEVVADPKETIGSVAVALDGTELDAYSVGPGTELYRQEFLAVGAGGPGTNHTLIVTARDDDGQPHSSVTRWTDAS